MLNHKEPRFSPATTTVLTDAQILKRYHFPENRLEPKLFKNALCWVSKEGVNRQEIDQVLAIQRDLKRPSVFVLADENTLIQNEESKTTILHSQSSDEPKVKFDYKMALTQSSESLPECRIALHVHRPADNDSIISILPQSVDIIIARQYCQEQIEQIIGHKEERNEPQEFDSEQFKVSEIHKPVENCLNQPLPPHILPIIQSIHAKLGKLSIVTIHKNSGFIYQDSDIKFQDSLQYKHQFFDSIYQGQVKTEESFLGLFNKVVPHGIGKCYCKDGITFFEGQWKNGLLHGYGRAIFDWGGFYQGMWENGDWHGKGHYENEKGDLYEGYWAKGAPHGLLKVIKENNTHQINGRSDSFEVLSGNWIHGRLNGKGKLWHKI